MESTKKKRCRLALLFFLTLTRIQQTATARLHLHLQETSLSSVCLVQMNQSLVQTYSLTLLLQKSLVSLQIFLKNHLTSRVHSMILFLRQSKSTRESFSTETAMMILGLRKQKREDFTILSLLLKHFLTFLMKRTLRSLKSLAFTARWNLKAASRFTMKTTPRLSTSKQKLCLRWQTNSYCQQQANTPTSLQKQSALKRLHAVSAIQVTKAQCSRKFPPLQAQSTVRRKNLKAKFLKQRRHLMLEIQARLHSSTASMSLPQ